LSGASPADERRNAMDHMMHCAECREQMVMIRQATQPNPEIENDPEFGRMLGLGEQAAQDAVQQHNAHMQAVVRTTQEEADSGWLDWLRPRRVAVLLTAMALLLVGLGGWWFLVYQSPVRKGMGAMQLAWRDQRSVEVRTSALSYAPWIQTRDNSD